jgi:hypothetical protein
MQIFCDNADYSKSDELRLALPLLLSDYHIDSSIDLNVELIPSPTATFIMHVAGAPAPLGAGRQQRHQADSRCALRAGPPGGQAPRVLVLQFTLAKYKPLHHTEGASMLHWAYIPGLDAP